MTFPHYLSFLVSWAHYGDRSFGVAMLVLLIGAAAIYKVNRLSALECALLAVATDQISSPPAWLESYFVPWVVLALDLWLVAFFWRCATDLMKPWGEAVQSKSDFGRELQSTLQKRIGQPSVAEVASVFAILTMIGGVPLIASRLGAEIAIHGFGVPDRSQAAVVAGLFAAFLAALLDCYLLLFVIPWTRNGPTGGQHDQR